MKIIAALFLLATTTEPNAIERGREIFLHTWTPGDPFAAGGDGLGPIYNASSCVACHSQAGPGGAGGNHNNVTLSGSNVVFKHAPITRSFIGIGRLGTAGLGRGVFSISVQRNTPALFGAGLIDEIPDDVIIANAETSRRAEISGKIVRTPEGRIARFGWKGDVAELSTFVARACSVEVGLEVPGSPQPEIGPRKTAPELDLTLEDLEALTTYVASLPKPIEKRESPIAHEGAELFDSIGCTSCHTPALGEVDGIYSDLLLHDMGDMLDDNANAGYYGAPPQADSREWRTPPLWGVRDSGPWLHDGRAATLEQAIAYHGGEARKVKQAYDKLRREERQAIIAFLESLVAPM